MPTLEHDNELRRAAQALEIAQLSAERLRLEEILQQMPAGVVITTVAGNRAVMLNTEAERLLDLYEVRGEPPHDVTTWRAQSTDGQPLPFSDWPHLRALSSGESLTKQLLRVGARGEGWLSVNASAIRNTRGEPVAAVITVSDVTEDLRRTDELRQAREAAEASSRAKSAFLANMSHEIRTPLGAMLGFIELLDDAALSEEARRQYLDIVARNGLTLSALIDDILDLARVEAGRLTLERAPVDLTELVDEALDTSRLSAEAKGVALVTTFAPDAPRTIATDRLRLRQILVNLIGNAVKFTARGAVRVAIRAEAERLVGFEVADDGIGISAEDAAKLFHPFSQVDESATREFGGTGLGLALSRRLARLLGGDVTLVRSSPGAGATFLATVRDATAATAPEPPRPDAPVPARSDAPDTTATEAPPTRRALAGLKVVLAEDSPDAQMFLKRVLTLRGIDVTVASDGAEAVAAALETLPDLILMDVQMPGVDGYAAASTLRARGYSGPIVALTAHAMPEDRTRSLAAGCDEHLTKPVDVKKLFETVERLTTPM